MVQHGLYNQNCENCSKSTCQTQFSLYLNRLFDGFFAFYPTLCRKMRATIWAKFCAIWSTAQEVIALFVILQELFSLYLNRFFDGFFVFYPTMCRKIRATIWANFCAIWSTASKVIALFVISFQKRKTLTLPEIEIKKEKCPWGICSKVRVLASTYINYNHSYRDYSSYRWL